MTFLAVLVPVLDRPQNVVPFLAALAGTTHATYRVLWLTDPGDAREEQTIREAGGQTLACGGNYAAKINRGVRETSEPWILLAADDIRPQRGWLPAALDAATATGASVVGLNDLIDRPTRPQHATHFLMNRSYAELPCIDGSPGPLHEGYGAWRCDDELIATAQHRGTYTYAPQARVLHLHPMAGTAPDDHVYQRGRAYARADGKLFHRRARLWT